MLGLLSRIDQKALFETVDAFEAGTCDAVVVLVPCYDAVDHNETLTVMDDPKLAQTTLAEWDCSYIDLTDFLRGVLAFVMDAMYTGNVTQMSIIAQASRGPH